MPIDAVSVPRACIYKSQHGLLDQVVLGADHIDALATLRVYFNQDPELGGLYTGRSFERFDGSGDRTAVRDQVTAADVLSLSFLSITDGVAVATTVTHAEEIATLLRQLPLDVPMYESPLATYTPESPAHELWRLLCRSGGKHRPVTANKLLARKRPHLLPVYDSQVAAHLGRPDSIWACLWTWFANDPQRATALLDLRTEAGGSDDISLLRCLDVVLWMRTTSDIRRRAQQRYTTGRLRSGHRVLRLRGPHCSWPTQVNSCRKVPSRWR
ncbi:DUF6308 family protein [Amycolatopsis sp. H20-H5]|uniref:DUF6308 family protein n=1 Tax=Amycolatopsis sp. H20-H5 TaxID=3046309 RepID=UPI002DBE1A56|nr:DUF6308 family protein [Amycolatopsis sp. H20-H5]MEC3982657.1 DUF6308 family protein [Amycolatopsis sp. H20-H5]